MHWLYWIDQNDQCIGSKENSGHNRFPFNLKEMKKENEIFGGESFGGEILGGNILEGKISIEGRISLEG